MKTILETLSDSLESSQNGRSLIENVNTALKERLSLRFTCAYGVRNGTGVR